MNRREILLDDEANQVLDELAESYGGNTSQAVSEILKLHSRLEDFLDEFEAANAMELRRQKDASEASFREGRGVDWEDVKRRNGL